MRTRQIKNTIKAYLESKGNLQESDEALIDNIPIILKVIKEAEKDFRINGLIIDNKKNPAIEIHSLYLNKLRETFIALGITPKERRKLEQVMVENTDDFDDNE